MLRKMDKFSMKKLCLTNSHSNNIDHIRKLYNENKGKFDICVILGLGAEASLSRLENQFQLVTPRPIPRAKNATGIYSIT